jgi:hypothetical protein
MVRLLLFHSAWGLLLALLGFTTRIELPARWLDDSLDSLRETEDMVCLLESSNKSLGPPWTKGCWLAKACIIRFFR